MTILADIRREVAKARHERAGKRTIDLGQREPQLVILVGNWHAYCADRGNEDPDNWAALDLNWFEDCRVERGPFLGVGVEWRA